MILSILVVWEVLNTGILVSLWSYWAKCFYSTLKDTEISYLKQKMCGFYFVKCRHWYSRNAMHKNGTGKTIYTSCEYNAIHLFVNYACAPWQQFILKTGRRPTCGPPRVLRCRSHSGQFGCVYRKCQYMGAVEFLGRLAWPQWHDVRAAPPLP